MPMVHRSPEGKTEENMLRRLPDRAVSRAQEKAGSSYQTRGVAGRKGPMAMKNPERAKRHQSEKSAR